MVLNPLCGDQLGLIPLKCVSFSFSTSRYVSALARTASAMEVASWLTFRASADRAVAAVSHLRARLSASGLVPNGWLAACVDDTAAPELRFASPASSAALRSRTSASSAFFWLNSNPSSSAMNLGCGTGRIGFGGRRITLRALRQQSRRSRLLRVNDGFHEVNRVGGIALGLLDADPRLA